MIICMLFLDTVYFWMAIKLLHAYHFFVMKINIQMELHVSGLILGLRPAIERQRYFVTMSLIGWAQT